MKTKICGSCMVEKPLTDYHKCKGRFLGVKSACKDCRKKKYELNAEYKKQKARDNYIKNAEKIKRYQKNYKKNNRAKINSRERKYKRQKRRTDEVYLLRENISCLIRNGMKGNGFTKKSNAENILGIDYEGFLNYLNSNKYGFKYGDKGLDLDHIIPISTAKNYDEVIKLNHYTNFQLLPSDYNRNVKIDNTWDEKEFEKYFGARALEKITKMRQ